MSTDRLRRILSIIFLVFIVAPIIIVLINNSIQDFLRSWQEQPHAIAASMRYRAIAVILEIIGSIAIAGFAPIIFKRLERVDRLYLVAGSTAIALISREVLQNTAM